MNEELNKSFFLADFYCSELAAEIYKVKGHEELIKISEILWETVLASKEEDDGDNYETY